MSNAGLDEFINRLPHSLRLEVSEEIHKENFNNLDLFKGIGSKNFLAWVSSRLKQQMFPVSTFFYQKGDLIDNFYFAIKGTSSFVATDLENAVFGIVDPVIFLARQRGRKISRNAVILQYFGAEDMVINVAAQVHDSRREDGDFYFNKNGVVGSLRFFSVQSVEETEVLALSVTELECMKRDFPICSEVFFKKMMQQTKMLLHEHLSTLENKDKRFKIMRWRKRSNTA